MSAIKFLLAAAFCLAIVTITASAATVISAKFVEDGIIVDSDAVVEFDIKDWNGTPIQLSPAIKPTTPAIVPEPIIWQLEGFNSNRVEIILGYKFGNCWDTVTGQIFATINTIPTASPTAIEITPHLRWDTEATYAAATGTDPVYTGVIRCSVGLSSKVTPTGFSFSYPNNAGSLTPADNTSYFDLAFPARGFVTPLIDFKAASISQASDDGFSTTEIKIEFTTDTAGMYTMTLVNGPKESDSVNHNDGKWADFWCSVGSNKKAVRIEYLGAYINLDVITPSTKDSIKCTIIYSNLERNQFVVSQRLAVRLRLASVIVTRGLDYKMPPAGVSAELLSSSTSGPDLELRITSTALDFSATSIKSNSTVVFTFSKHIDIATVLLTEGSRGTSYRNNENCDNLAATSFVDSKANTITLKDVEFSRPFGALDCTFEFRGSEVFQYQDSADMATVLVSIDGNDLVSRQAPTKETPIYFNTVGLLDFSEQTVSEEGGKYTIVDVISFKDKYATTHTNMQNPLLMVQINGAQLFNMEDYQKQVSCEATSPTSSQFESLKLKFDAQRYFWSVKLDKLVNIDSYAILIRCTRSFPKLTKYGLDTTPSSSLSLGVYNLLDGKRYFDGVSGGSAFYTTQSLATPASSVYPTDRSVQLGFMKAQFSLLEFTEDGIKAGNDKFTAATAESLLKATPTQSAFSYKSIQSINTKTCENIGYQYLNYKHAEQEYDLRVKVTNEATSFAVSSPAQVRFVNSINKYLWSYSHACTSSISRFFTVAAPTTDPMANIVWNDPTTTAYKDAVKAFFPAKFNTDILNPAVTFLSDMTTINISPVTDCGVDAGRYVVSPTTNYDFTPTAGATQGDLDSHWATFKSLDRGYLRCQEAEKCVYNADCEANLSCKGGVCTTMPTYPSPYSSTTLDQSKAFDKDYFNSAKMISTFIAMVAVVVAVIA